jgi:hypothetical protein
LNANKHQITREESGKQIAERPDQIKRIDENTFSDLIKKADLSWGSHISKEFGKEIKN